MRFKKPFRAVPIKPDPAYLERRKILRARPPAQPTAKPNIEDEGYDRPTSPTNYQYKPARRGWGVGSIILVGFVIGVIAGGGFLALERGGLTKLGEVAVAAGIIRAREPQPGDYWPACNAAREAGAAPIYAGEPGYRPELDRDGDGIACEPYREL
jgi:hypothetical protein